MNVNGKGKLKFLRYPPEADNELSKNPEHIKEVVTNAAKSLAGHTSQILGTCMYFMI